MALILYAKISKENHERLLKKFLPSFSWEFQKRVLSFRTWEDSQLSLLGRLVLRNGLARMNVDLNKQEINFNPQKKPFLKCSPIEFNISHSGNIVICAIAENVDIGIDIEEVKKIHIVDFKNQMLNSEWERLLSASNQSISFFTYWTQKEAVIKANGMGLSIPLKSFKVVNNQTKLLNQKYYLREVKLESNYKCYVACSNKSTILRNKILKLCLADLQ